MAKDGWSGKGPAPESIQGVNRAVHRAGDAFRAGGPTALGGVGILACALALALVGAPLVAAGGALLGAATLGYGGWLAFQGWQGQ